MKTKLAFFILISFSSLNAQDWFSDNSYWTYGCCTDLFAPAYLKVYPKADTVINNVTAKYITGDLYIRNDFNEINTQEFDPFIAYEQNDIIYVQVEQEFDTLYNFNAIPGDAWNIYVNSWLNSFWITVLDTGQTTINNVSLRWQHIQFTNDLSSPWSVQDTIVERIGPLHIYFLPWYSYYLAGEPSPLRCYFDEELGEYNKMNTPDGDCEFLYLWDATTEANKYTANIFPNPVNDKLTIELSPELFDKELNAEIYTPLGELVFYEKIDDREVIDLNKFPAGLYFLLVKENGLPVFTERIIKE